MKSNHQRLNYFLLLFVFFFNATHAQYQFKEDQLPKSISLFHYTTIADVGQQNLKFVDVMKNYALLYPFKLKTDNDDLGFTNHHFWAKFSLENTTNRPLEYYLETARPITDLAELYQVNSASGQIKKSISGDALPFFERSFQDRKTIFKINLSPHEKADFYIHLKSDGETIKMPVQLRDTQSFIQEVSFEEWFFGVFYGILLTAAIIYLFFFVAMREQTFLYYSLYVVFIGLMQFALDGYFFKLIAPQSGWFNMHSVLIFAMIAGILLGKYSEVFLKVKQHNLFLYRAFNGVYVLAALLILVIVFVPSAFAICYPLANVLGLFVLILIISSVAHLYWNKKPVDLFYSVGIVFLIMGFGIFILNNFGQVPNNFFTLNSSKFGTGLEIIFLSLSMGNLIRNLKNEKEEFNRLALIRLEEMNELKSYFLSNISHELRTPLNAILNLTDSMLKESADEKFKQNCQVIKYSSHSLLSSVNDILDFSKIEKGELKLERVLFEPVKVLEHLKNNAAIRAKDQGLEFEFIKSDNIPEHLLGDVTRLVQIVNNVLSNALKFTAHGFVKFELDALIKPENKASLIIRISDSGIGISKEKMHSIYESFSQSSIDNKRKFGGLGLGLFIVKNLVDLKGGSIQIDSVENVGTHCKMVLDYDIAAVEQSPVIKQENQVFDLGGKKILVVEDNAINQMVIKMIVKKWLNTEVKYANNGQEALEILKQESFDLILMDLQMPVMDGYEATIAIRNGQVGEKYKDIPIVAVTADVMETTKMRVKEIGMNHYLSKPLKNDALYEVVVGLI